MTICTISSGVEPFTIILLTFHYYSFRISSIFSLFQWKFPRRPSESSEGNHCHLTQVLYHIFLRNSTGSFYSVKVYSFLPLSSNDLLQVISFTTSNKKSVFLLLINFSTSTYFLISRCFYHFNNYLDLRINMFHFYYRTTQIFYVLNFLFPYI